MFNLSIAYDNASNLTYNSTLVETVGSNTKLKKINLAPDEILGASFRVDGSLDRSLATLTGTFVGSAKHTNLLGVGYVDLRGGNFSSYLSLDPSNSISNQQACLRVKMTPNYNDKPSIDSHFFTQSLSNGNANSAIRIWHEASTGLLRAYISNSSGSTALDLRTGAWSAVIDQEYELEFNLDFTNGTAELYVDGVKLNEVSLFIVASWSVGSIGFMALGATHNPATSSANCLLRDLQIFNSVQHSSSFSGEIPRTFEIYSTLPQLVIHNSPITTDGLLSFDSAYSTATSESEVRFILQFAGQAYYWDSLAWVISDGSIAQSNDPITFKTNFSAFPTPVGANLSIHALLISVNGIDTPTITSISIGFDFFAIQGLCETTLIHGYILDGCSPVEDAIVHFVAESIFYINGNFQWINHKATTNHLGYFEIELPETETAGKTIDAIISFYDSAGEERTLDLLVIVPKPTDSIRTKSLEEIIKN